MINSPYSGLSSSANYGIHHGDMIEGKMIDHPHYQITGSEPSGIVAQMWKSVAHLTPIRKKMITILQGNHERSLHRVGDITGYVCRELDIPYGTYSCRVAYVCKRTKELLFKQFATHGRRGVSSTADDIVRRKSNMQLSLKRHLRYEAGDTVLMTKGHTHKLFHLDPQPELFLTSDDGRIKQDYTSIRQNDSYIPPDLRFYVNVGAFFRKYGDELLDYELDRPLDSARSSYVEEGEYPPTELGFAVALVRDGEVVEVREEVVD
jgi:hypothetical protein